MGSSQSENRIFGQNDVFGFKRDLKKKLDCALGSALRNDPKNFTTSRSPLAIEVNLSELTGRFDGSRGRQFADRIRAFGLVERKEGER